MTPQDLLVLLKEFGLPLVVLVLIFTGWLFPKPHVVEVQNNRDRCYVTQDRMMTIVDQSHGLQKEMLEKSKDQGDEIAAIRLSLVRLEGRG